MGTDEFATETPQAQRRWREKSISPNLFDLTLCLRCLRGLDKKIRPEGRATRLNLPAYSVGECCSAYSSSATLKLICGTRYCPLTNRSVWSFSTPAASVFNSVSPSSLYFPFAKSSR